MDDVDDYLANGGAKAVQNTVPTQTSGDPDVEVTTLAERKLRLKVDLRLCTIAGLLCSVNLLDSDIISSASVTSMLEDLDLTGNRYSVSIFIFTVSSIIFQLPSTILLRFIGPRLFFATITTCFGIITLSTAFIRTWRQMIALRVLLGISMSGIYPGVSYLISTWYTRKEQQLRFAFLQSGDVCILATGSIVNFGLNHLDGHGGLRGWRWMFLVQGTITTFLGLLTYVWMVDFPENSQNSFHFLSPEESVLAVSRINIDRSDSGAPSPFHLRTSILKHFLDPKLYYFCLLFFLLNIVSTALSYFLPIILQSGMGFSPDNAILLSSLPYYYAVIPVLLSSYLADKYRTRG
jgi:MFS family permease